MRVSTRLPAIQIKIIFLIMKKVRMQVIHDCREHSG